MTTVNQKIKKITKVSLSKPIPVYDLTTSTGTFCIGRSGAVVHNCYNYHHAETAAQQTAIGMAQEWSNNLPIFNGYGNFGSRKVPDAAAPRYIFATLSKNFEKYFKDLDVCPVSSDPENPEPEFYLPTIPWVLVNGIKGIATGFATNILPRDPKDLTNAVKKIIKNPDAKLDLIKPTYPDFKGEVIHVVDNTWKIRGIVEEVGAFYYKISEVPYGDDRATVVSYLNSLIDDNKINDYDDNCSDRGFEFLVKVSRSQKEVIEKDPIKFFKLEKQVTENLTMIGHDGKIKIFDDPNDVIRYFVAYRKTKVAESMALELSKLELEEMISIHKIAFISHAIDGLINFNVMTKQDLLDYIDKKITSEEYGKAFINIPMYQLTLDSIKKLENDSCEISKNILELKKETVESRYLGML